MQLPHDHPSDLLPGVILAGGRATRMGGGDKGLLSLGDGPMLAHVITRLAPQVGPLALNANGDPARFAAFGLPVLADEVAGFPGPLAGILAAMDWAAAQGAEQVLTAAADTPFLPLDLAVRLRAAKAPVALAKTASGLHPTFGLWPVALRASLADAIASGTRKVAAWALGEGAVAVRFDDTPLDPFFNINTPQDLAKARGHLAGNRP